MVVFVPVLYVLGGMAVRATTSFVAKKLLQAGAKKVTEAVAKKNIGTIKDISTNKVLIEFLKKTVSRTKSTRTKPTIDLKIKPSPKPVAKPKVDKTVNKTTTKPTSTTTKPIVKQPKKVTTTQKNITPSKPTVNKTTNKPTTPKPKPKPKSSKNFRKSTPTEKIFGIGLGIASGGVLYKLLDKSGKIDRFVESVQRKDKPVTVDKTTDKLPEEKKEERKSTIITPKPEPKKDDKLKNLRTTPKDEDAILSKIAAPKPKSNISKFGRAFKNARKQKRYSFNFNGNEITTRFKEETVAEHKKKFGKK